jgi:hypothetical protein
MVNTLRHALGLGATVIEGAERFDQNRRLHRYHDGVRERGVSSAGYMPYAYTVGMSPVNALSVGLTLAANGGAGASPVVLESHMLLQSVDFYNGNTSVQRGPVEFAIYEDRLDNTASLPQIATGTLAAFTPTVGSRRNIDVDGAPIYLPAGCYWVVLKNNNATQTLIVGGVGAGTMSLIGTQTKTFTTAALAATLDLETGWTKQTYMHHIQFSGRVFDLSTAF